MESKVRNIYEWLPLFESICICLSVYIIAVFHELHDTPVIQGSSSIESAQDAAMDNTVLVSRKEAPMTIKPTKSYAGFKQ